MFCSRCGAQLPDGAEFCGSCGLDLRKKASLGRGSTIKIDSSSALFSFSACAVGVMGALNLFNFFVSLPSAVGIIGILDSLQAFVGALLYSVLALILAIVPIMLCLRGLLTAKTKGPRGGFISTAASLAVISLVMLVMSAAFFSEPVSSTTSVQAVGFAVLHPFGGWIIASVVVFAMAGILSVCSVSNARRSSGAPQSA